MSDLPPLINRTILITGAAGGFGSALSEIIARQGGNVILLGRKVPALETLYDRLVSCAPEGKHSILPFDLNVTESLTYQALAETLFQEYGALDAVIHNAVSFKNLAPLLMTSPSVFQQQWNVQIFAPLLMTQQLYPLLKQSEKSQIVFIEDQEALHPTHAFYGSYAINKAALEQMRNLLSQELEHSGVNVWGFSPSAMQEGFRQRIFPGTTHEHLPNAHVMALSCVEKIIRTFANENTQKPSEAQNSNDDKF